MRCDEIRDGDVVVRRPSSSVVVCRHAIRQSIHPSIRRRRRRRRRPRRTSHVHVTHPFKSARARWRYFPPIPRAIGVFFVSSMKKWSVFPYGYLVYAFTRTIRVATRSNTGDFRSNKGRARSNQTTLPVPPPSPSLLGPSGGIVFDRCRGNTRLTNHHQGRRTTTRGVSSFVPRGRVSHVRTRTGPLPPS